MATEQTIDIVIPSYRLLEDVLLKIINLPRPENFETRVYIAADNPSARIPERIDELSKFQKITLIKNKINLGFSASRNIGIRAGNGKWILLLDDDIEPDPTLLIEYSKAIYQHPDAIGFAGATNFPSPTNNKTKALKISGITAHFEAARNVSSMKWAPTANLMLNRSMLDEALFDETLKYSGEDIEFLVRNSLRFNKEYISVPAARVNHPWWDRGNIPTKKLLRYGIGASQVAGKKPANAFTYTDFTNTSESLLILLLCLFPALLLHKTGSILFLSILVIVSELITNYLKTIIVGKTFSPIIAWHLACIKNCREFGYLYGSLSRGYLQGFAQRIELGFTKPNPSPFRLNRWKIIKSLIILSGIVLKIAI